MPSILPVYRCLLISPSDVQQERDAIVSAVHVWNAHTGLQLGARIEVVGWESHASPEMGAPPQTILNRQIVDGCDFGVAIFWSRIGSPTQSHRSGSAEEIARLHQRGANVLVYFSRQPVPQEHLRDDQYFQLQKLRKEYEVQALVREYSSTDNLVHQVTQHLTGVVGRSIAQDAAESEAAPSEVGRKTRPRRQPIEVDVEDWFQPYLLVLKEGEDSSRPFGTAADEWF